MKYMAVIPARAGSVGVKHKNSRLFLGHPLVHWSVMAAQQSKHVDYIVISSDCGILRDYYKNNSQIIWVDRPEHLSGPKSSTESALVHAVECLSCLNCTHVITLQPTSPIRLKSMIDNAIDQMVSQQKHSLLSVSEHTPFFLQEQNSQVKWYFNRHERKMRQELTKEEMFYHDDGNLFITDIKILLDTECRLNENPSLYINDSFASFQIDTELDWLFAEIIIQEMKCKNMYVHID